MSDPCPYCGRGDLDFKAAASQILMIVRGVVHWKMSWDEVTPTLAGHWAGRVLGRAQGEWGRELRKVHADEQRTARG